MRMLLPSALILQIMIGIGCGESPSALEAQQAPEPRPSISDAAHGGQDHFYFLPPLVPQPDYSGTFDPARSPVVSICKVEGTACGQVIGEFSMTTGPGSETVRVDTLAEHYIVNWHTAQFDLEEGAIYRIRVLIEGQEAGHADVLAVSGGNQLKNAESEDIIPLKDGRTLPIKFRIEAGFQLGAIVPAQAPNSVPEGFYDESNLSRRSPCISGPYLKDIVVVVFRPEATQLQRQQAVDQVNGKVVGGIRSTSLEGHYYIQLPTDDTGENVCDAKYFLRTLPYVGHAGHSSFVAGPLYRRPHDENAWEKDQWQVNPDSIFLSQRWGLEMIAAPLAWGCEVGSDSTAIAIVDGGFQGVTDLKENIRSEWQGDLGLNPLADHGTKVASIAAARGNNGEGITGLMWKADLRPYEALGAGGVTFGSLPSDVIAERVKKAIVDGADVVNLSLGINWQRTFGRPPGSVADSVAHDIDLSNDFHFDLRNALQEFDAGELPMLVLAAGNDGPEDAKWSGFPQVANDFPERVIVVGSSTFLGALDPSSSRGNLVHIAAPGEAVVSLDGEGNPVLVGGTSFAAPYVTGLAGLLKSFDPGLTTVDLRQLILDGAARSGGSAGGLHVLDAYESLRMAAERSGAPLCGNDVWAAGGNLKVRRKTDPDMIEELAPVGSPIGQVEVLHGGKFIRYLTPPQTAHTLHWKAESRAWESGSLPADSADLRGGTRASVFGLSHERDSLSFVDATVVSGTPWFLARDTEEAPVMVQAQGAAPQEVGRITVNDLPGPVQVTCLERSASGCHLNVVENRTWIFRLGYPQFPRGIHRQAYVTVSPMRHVEIDSTPWAPCTFDQSHECRAILSLQDQTEALVYRMDLTTGAVSAAVDTIDDESVFWIGQSEMGERVVLARGRWRITFWADAPHFYQTGSPFFDFNSEVERCTIEYRRETDFTSLHSIPAGDACNFGLFNRPSIGAGGGTIAPSRVPLSMAPSSSITTAEGVVSVTLPILDPTGEELRDSEP